MARELRIPEALTALPAPVRWLAVPVALTCTVVALVGSWSSADPAVEVPQPSGRVAGYCKALAAALPQELLGRPRRDPSPTSPYVAAWGGSPRTVLRCGVDRPEELNGEHAEDWSPTVDDVTWWSQKLSDGGYRFVTTMRAAYVEVTVPAGAAQNAFDPAAALTPAVKANIPG
ncbi:DUF3515 domain-containing protein [Kitasatospora aureofaciens]|uniref:DUF3515 domain-containing protein n=1 Tax=Kitasatospora aureofaciens TaxID=1894 RepID=UPI00099741B0|nr:DUF3515 domain-containing protein [Kitasatospora aureofaciens]HJD85457.1 DUF3515 domain-containing protein [Kitasatospora aureofaciens]